MWFVDVFFVIVCDAVENYVFFTVSKLGQVFEFWYSEVPRIVHFHIPCKVEQFALGQQILKRKFMLK